MTKKIFLIACSFLVVGCITASTTKKRTKMIKSTVAITCSQSFQNNKKAITYSFPIDKNGYITIFDGKNTNGWRGYGKDKLPSLWSIEDGNLTFAGTKTNGEGGDIIFAHKFKNFELELDWKVDKGSNSGIFYLAQEVKNNKGGMEPIYISAPEYQVLDNVNHPDAKLGKDGDRQSASLYDMIPAKPQNQKPYGQWNKAKIRIYNGKVTHYQNGEAVVQYQLWTPEWTQMLQSSKFSEAKWPVAFQLLNNCGGPNHEGFIGLQDHGNKVWFRNIRIKILK